jgi:hypothetical protein
MMKIYLVSGNFFLTLVHGHQARSTWLRPCTWHNYSSLAYSQQVVHITAYQIAMEEASGVEQF